MTWKSLTSLGTTQDRVPKTCIMVRAMSVCQELRDDRVQARSCITWCTMGLTLCMKELIVLVRILGRGLVSAWTTGMASKDDLLGTGSLKCPGGKACGIFSYTLVSLRKTH